MTSSASWMDLIEDIKVEIGADVIKMAAKGGSAQVKQTILEQYFVKKWETGNQKRREQATDMSERRKQHIANMFDLYGIEKYVTDSVGYDEATEEEKALKELEKARMEKVQGVMDGYIMRELTAREAKRELREHGYGEDQFWDLWDTRSQELRAKEVFGPSVALVQQARRTGLIEALPEEEIYKAKVGFAQIAKAGARKRFIEKQAQVNARISAGLPPTPATPKRKR